MTSETQIRPWPLPPPEAWPPDDTEESIVGTDWHQTTILNLRWGIYARAGVREYLALDSTGQFLREGIRAWRLAEDVYRPWEPGAEGRWHSVEIGVAIGLEGTLATVYTSAGRRMLHEGEVEEELDRLRAELEHLRRRLGEP